MTNAFKIKDSVAFVTGTNRKNGIGRAIVEALLENGAAKVYATARDASQLDDLVTAHNGKVIAVELDVTDFAAIRTLPSLYPDVTIVVNNAGYLAFSSSLNDFTGASKEMEVNYLAPLAIVESFAPVLQNQKISEQEQAPEKTKATAVVNVISIAGLVNFPAGGTYSASKAAAHSLTQAQRRDLPQSLVIGVYPGPIDTDIIKDLPYVKSAPRVVALAIVEALQNGTEDVFPDPSAVQLFNEWKTDAKAAEQMMTRSVYAAQN
jgi:NAD(P)-dependent dehydrogenase (short-subunit alcohol dehydrogenase family)